MFSGFLTEAEANIEVEDTERENYTELVGLIVHHCPKVDFKVNVRFD
jgi:hypothetical protein